LHFYKIRDCKRKIVLLLISKNIFYSFIGKIDYNILWNSIRFSVVKPGKLHHYIDQFSIIVYNVLLINSNNIKICVKKISYHCIIIILFLQQ